MKILVIQLARLGDIFQTWPALRALKKANPEVQIDVLCRSRFSAAFDGLDVISERIILPSQDVMRPMLEPQMDVKSAHEILSQFVIGLKDKKYDRILNLSFSPFSSYLTHAIASETCQVSGYTRTSDGFLAIPDDMSAYFYAQVGVGKPNRFHLVEIFATMAGVDLQDGDWAPPSHLTISLDAPEVLIHVGASETKKQISPIKWATVINQLNKLGYYRVGLIGTNSEVELAEQISTSVAEGIVTSYVGKTNIAQLFALIAGAKVVVGSDSAPMHMASLTGTSCVNLSMSAVNFWETGPRAKGSVILRGADETDFASDRVAMVIKRVLCGEKQELSVIKVQAGSPSYWLLEPKEADFEWNLIKAIYMNEDFPQTENPLFRDSIIKLADINLLLIDQMEAIQKGLDIAKVAGIIDRGEEIIETVARLVPMVAPLVRWYQTEKVRIGPDSQEVLLRKSLGVQGLLQRVLDLYLESFGMTHDQVKSSTEVKA